MPPSASDTLGHLAQRLLADSTALVAGVLEEIAAALPELAGDPRLRAVLAGTVQDTIRAGLQVLGSGAPVSGVRAPDVGLDLARHLAQRNIPISVMLRAYRLGQAAFQRELIDLIAATSAEAREVAAAARDLASVTFSIVDAVSEEVVAAYQTERDGWVRQRNTARLATVTALLASRPADTDTAPGYDLAPGHVAAVLWCGPEVDDPRLERLVPGIAAALGCVRPPLVVAPDASTLWGWFPASAIRADAVTEVLLGAPGTFAALGDPAPGPAGFRSSHRQARQGQQVAAAAAGRGPRLTTPELLGPLALLALDPTSAAPWVRAALGGLADDDEPAARLRETLWVYLSTGGSLAAAAAELHVHRNTIQYRVRRAEQVRGRPLTEGRIDVEVALLACRVLGSTVLRPAPDA
ncbi:helix-turn-helix domain-containing protein [Pseudonocardia petroleophila]|uniref:Helix-turn-helix domain-containing protein n=1 Tax=Pseudonocardia petroleophila TaxID=37331 RepID=A0A7G7MB60_9PSEU|nr:helix-turn-helix domain-containing protein [Pseudonocardia petroleophila]QNG50021.1 helix-turn-helix domain-containing protein [Pseudonocardia petroleophila]